MIVSHKHKFIFIKTHKTATQTFYNVIKPHLGSEDVLVGDEAVPHPDDNSIIYDTSLNVNKKFETGLCGEDARSVMGNHIPWFTIKEIVGDDIWDEYTKFTIERSPTDRMVSLFCFLHPLLVRTKARANPSLPIEQIREIQSKTPLELEPDGLRNYFKMWTEVQLEADILDLVDKETYSASVVERERNNNKQTARQLNYDVFFYDRPSEINILVGQTHFCNFPPLNNNNILVSDGHFRNKDRPGVYQRYLSFEGQCRFLNYGYYHDGEDLKVDEILDFRSTISDIQYLNDFFTRNNINIHLTSNEWVDKSLNTQFRKKMDRWGISPLPKTAWWYSGPGGQELQNKIENKFKNYVKS